jgi:hypothetical protein
MSGMKSSTIKVTLRAVMRKWINSIEDESVRKQVEQDAFITGGAVASMLQGEMPNDFDIYFKTKATALAVATYYTSTFVKNKNDKLRADLEEWYKNPVGTAPRQTIMHEPIVVEKSVQNCKGEFEDRVLIYIKSAGVASEDQDQYQYFESRPTHETEEFMNSLSVEDAEYNEFSAAPVEYTENLVSEVEKHPGRQKKELVKKPFRPMFMSENAITLSDHVQLVVRFYGQPADIHVNYDFAHCMCWYDYSADHLELPAEALQVILSKTLVYKGSLYPLASIFRLRKFIARGWRITAGQLLKIMLQISKIDLNDIKTLREQLIGVDQAYMHQLLRALEQKDVTIDQAYITSLIDKIFEE